jgi:hypothetical protein
MSHTYMDFMLMGYTILNQRKCRPKYKIPVFWFEMELKIMQKNYTCKTTKNETAFKVLTTHKSSYKIYVKNEQTGHY